MPIDPILARLLAARLCHDLGGVVGTLAGTLDLVEPGDPVMLDLARESAAMLRLRLRLYVAAWAGGATDLDADGLATLLQGASAAPRVRFSLDRLAPGGVIPAAVVPLLLNAALLTAEALPRGGVVHLAGDLDDGLSVWPEGTNAAWPPGFAAVLAGNSAEDLLDGGPRRLLAPLLLSLADEAGWRLSIPAASQQDGCPPLALSRASPAQV